MNPGVPETPFLAKIEQRIFGTSEAPVILRLTTRGCKPISVGHRSSHREFELSYLRHFIRTKAPPPRNETLEPPQEEEKALLKLCFFFNLVL